MTPTTGKAPAGEAEAFQNDLDTYAGAVSTPHYTQVSANGKASDLLLPVVQRLERDADRGRYPDNDGEHWTLCPFHPDHTVGSFSFNAKTYNCFSCGAQGHLSELAKHLGIEAPKREPAGCTLMDYASYKRLPVSFLQSIGLSDDSNEYGPRVAMPYFNQAGHAEAIRYRVSLNGTGKRFFWRKGDKAKGIPYGLPHLPEAGYVILVEGESDCHTLWRYGLPALGVPGAENWNPAWTTYLDGLSVYVWQETDDAGQAFTEKVCRSLPGALVLKPAGVKDVSEAHVKGMDVPALIEQLKAQAQPWQGPQAPTPATLSDYLTHGANGRRFAQKFNGKALFNTTSERWMTYDGRRWTDDAERELQRMAKTVVMDLYAMVSTIDNEDTRKALASFARRCDSPTGTEAMLSEAANLMPVRAETFDKDPRYFNVLNGTLDLTTGELLPHNPAHRISQLAPVVYDPAASCPTYDTAMLAIFAGDKDTKRFFEEAAGATLSGRATKNMIFMLGDSGDNGKSTVANMLMELFGDYATKGDSSLLVRGDRYDPHRAQPTIVALKGKRFCVVQEIPQGRTMDETLVKDLTGGDPITARRLHENTMTFWPSHMLWVYGNHRLKVEDTVVFNRLYEIPFNVEFAKGDPKRDEHMPEKLRAELPGILNRFLAGYKRFTERGYQLSPSHRVTKATASYRQESDSVARFMGERFAIMRTPQGDADERYTEGATELFNYYKVFCIAEDLTAANQTQFGKALNRMGIPARKDKPVVRVGIRRLTDDEREATLAGLQGNEDDEDPRF